MRLHLLLSMSYECTTRSSSQILQAVTHSSALARPILGGREWLCGPLFETSPKYGNSEEWKPLWLTDVISPTLSAVLNLQVAGERRTRRWKWKQLPWQHKPRVGLLMLPYWCSIFGLLFLTMMRRWILFVDCSSIDIICYHCIRDHNDLIRYPWLVKPCSLPIDYTVSIWMMVGIRLASGCFITFGGWPNCLWRHKTSKYMGY